MISKKHNKSCNGRQFLSIKKFLRRYCFRSWLYCIFVLIVLLCLEEIIMLFNIDSNYDEVDDFEGLYDPNFITMLENGINNYSILCGGCFFSKITKHDDITCGHYIRQHVYQSFGIIMLVNYTNSSKEEKQQQEREQWIKLQQTRMLDETKYVQLVRNAAHQISIDFPYVCSRCNPAACNGTSSTKNTNSSSSGSIYYSYDVAAPKIQQSWSYYLKSIPIDNRYPLYGIENPEEFLSHTENRNKSYVFEFNPSIISIPDHERQQHTFQHPITGIVTYPVYLVSFRVSQTFWCMDIEHRKKIIDKSGLELMGLAYLDEHFVILAEGVYTIFQEDVRLVTLPSPHNNQQQQIYLTYSTGVLAVQRELWLNKPDTNIPYATIQPLYIDDTNQTIPPIYVSTTPNCLTVTNAVIQGKNILYFEDATITSQTMPQLVVDGVKFTAPTSITTPVIVAEIWPPQDDGINEVSFVELQNPRWCPSDYQYIANKSHGEMVSDNQYRTNINSPIQPSFYTIEEQWFGNNLISHTIPWENERGSACCIEMIDPRTNKIVLVGISHANIRSDNSKAYDILPVDTYDSMLFSGHNSYVSRFYAFEPQTPYRTFALSGHFCWPIITSSVDDSSSSSSNQFVNKGDKLHYIRSTNQTGIGWCPKIHFVMSLVYKVNSNKSSVIVALGVNDCTPRFIELLTSDISELLFYGFSRQ